MLFFVGQGIEPFYGNENMKPRYPLDSSPHKSSAIGFFESETMRKKAHFQYLYYFLQIALKSYSLITSMMWKVKVIISISVDSLEQTLEVSRLLQVEQYKVEREC